MIINITNLTLDEIENIIINNGYPKYRAKQLYNWLHTKNINSYNQITNLPKSLIEFLEKNYPLEQINNLLTNEDSEGTKKFIFQLSDGNLVESVGISSNQNKLSVCISSQVGCPIGCKFCATGKEKFIRNLTSDEIVMQVREVSKEFNLRTSSIVLMGQGEPFLNFKNVITAVKRLNTDDCYKIGARHITISTCGVLEGIKEFSNIKEQFRLAVSLHSAIQSTRDYIMPNLKHQKLKELKETLIEYQIKRNRRITLEYLLINEVNDTQTDLDALIDFCNGLNIHINLLLLNASPGSSLKPSSISSVNHWCCYLNNNGIKTTIRNSKGSEISGACGQLKNTVI
jgi:23S rRNA (adenine2503-C2)-methyltransferase